ncbi:MAG: PLP-dependent transferase [Bdellovibrionota bacterium]
MKASLGGVPILSPSHHNPLGNVPEDQKRYGVDDSLVRISVGIEDWRDILTDIEQALSASSLLKSDLLILVHFLNEFRFYALKAIKLARLVSLAERIRLIFSKYSTIQIFTPILFSCSKFTLVLKRLSQYSLS